MAMKTNNKKAFPASIGIMATGVFGLIGGFVAASLFFPTLGVFTIGFFTAYWLSLTTFLLYGFGVNGLKASAIVFIVFAFLIWLTTVVIPSDFPKKEPSWKTYFAQIHIDENPTFPHGF